jgi:hypothetical protein
MSLLEKLGLPPLPARAHQPAAAVKKADDGRSTGAALKPERLSQAAAGWRQTHRQADERIEALKAAIKAHYAETHPSLLMEIEKGVAKLDGVLDNVDHRLADVMVNAGKASDDGARLAQLKSGKALLTQYIIYVKSEPLIAHMDRNPFGVKTDLRALLATGLTDAAKAMG